MDQENYDEEEYNQKTEGRYQFKSKLGKGTYGRVVLALDKTTQEMVAVKRIFFHVKQSNFRTKKRVTRALL